MCLLVAGAAAAVYSSLLIVSFCKSYNGWASLTSNTF